MSDAVAITPKPTRNARSILPRPPAKSPHRTFGTGVALAIVMAAAPSLLRAGPPMRPTDESGNECLARAVRLVEQDKYDDAAPWYRAAVQRTLHQSAEQYGTAARLSRACLKGAGSR